MLTLSHHSCIRLLKFDSILKIGTYDDCGDVRGLVFQLSLSCVDSGGRSWGVVWVVGVRSRWRVGSPRGGVTRPRRTPWTRGRVPIAHVRPTKSSCTTSRSPWRSSAWHLALIWVVVMVLGGRMLLVRVVRWPIFTHWVPVWPANSASVSLRFCFILQQDNTTPQYTKEDIVRKQCLLNINVLNQET